MRYISTRGEARAASFFEAMLAGLAPDGGLFVPEAWPHLSPGEIAGFSGRPYAEVAARILGAFVGAEAPAKTIAAICHDTYAGFGHPATAPLEQLGPDVFLLNLHCGPSLAFKDFAMQLLARLYDHVLAAEERRLTVLCATSGDTGGAAVEALRGRANVDLVVLYPEGRISEVQRRFMTTAAEDNVSAVAVAGDFDDCQAIVKTLLADRRFVRETHLTAVNSINFARIAAQSVYYFVAAAALGAPHRRCAFAVPSGNLGNAYSAWSAHRMGLAMAPVIVATNANDIVARALTTGRYRRGPAVATQSPAMDIQVASNFERFYFEYAGREPAETAAAFAGFAAVGALDLPSDVQRGAGEFCQGIAVSEAETSAAMRETFEGAGVLVDPHTAVAIAAAAKAGRQSAEGPLVVLATAHPAKFPEAVTAATGAAPDPPPAVAALAGKPERISRLPADAEAVREFVRDFIAGRSA